MAGWLDKAGNVFRRNTPEVEHPFAVPCECGLMHRGMRRNRSQKIVCRECGASRFVLPKDVYPAPKDRPREAAPPPAALPVLNPIKDGGGKKSKKPGGQSARPTAQAARDAAPEFLVAPTRRKLLTPFRMVALGIVVVVAVTGSLVVQKMRRDAAAKLLREATDSAWSAVDNGDWPVARRQFEMAVDAADVLGRDDATVRKLRCGLRETTAIEQLCAQPLDAILREADGMVGAGDKWKTQFTTHYEGRWLVFDGPLESRIEGWRVPFPVLVGGKKRPVRLVMQSSAFSDLNEKEAAQGVIFAARLAGCELSADKAFWDVTFDASSVFLWSLPQTFAAIGIDAGEFRNSEQTAALLAQQAELNGVPGESTP